jgi:hypothetical protein
MLYLFKSRLAALLIGPQLSFERVPQLLQFVGPHDFCHRGVQLADGLVELPVEERGGESFSYLDWLLLWSWVGSLNHREACRNQHRKLQNPATLMQRKVHTNFLVA